MPQLSEQGEQERPCKNCETTTKHEDFGLVPLALFNGDLGETWTRVTVCKLCGTIRPRETTEEELEHEEQRYVEYLQSIGVVDSDDADEVLGGE